MGSYDGFEFNALELRLKMTLDSLSNGGSIDIKDEWINDSSAEFKAALNRQLKPEERTFRLRASNIGKPLCQLQLDAVSASPDSRMPYNHVLRMMVGDATEAVVTLIIKASGANITGQKGKVEYKVGGTIIKGEKDIDIDGKVYDVKSASTYSFNNKWSHGWDGLFSYDTFGYVEQLFIYAEGDREKMGGWIVFDKSSGEIKVIPATPTLDQMDEIQNRLLKAEFTIQQGLPFKKLYEAEAETFYKKPTGNYVVPMTCTFCNHMNICWPDAKYTTNPLSKAKEPARKWYTYIGDVPDEV
jgi:hypothetical protein